MPSLPEPRPAAPTPLEPDDGDPQPARRLALLEQLGSGGMGLVMRAIQRSLGREVAVKIAHLGANLPAFRSEAACTALLEHPAIVPVYDAGPNFMVMRLIRGRTLEQLATDQAPLVQMVDALVRACDALAYAHSRGVVHRDVKPENIMVGDFGEITLVDWGLATSIRCDDEGRWIAPPLAQLRSVKAGTPGFMAPEAARGERSRIGEATDVFMVGATLYRLIAGCAPYDTPDPMDALTLAMEGRFVSLSELAPDAPTRLISLVEACLAVDPRSRPRMDEVRERLHTWIAMSGGEREAATCREKAGELLASAREARRPEEAYRRYGQALRQLDRAEALNPDDPRIAADRSSIRHAFILAAVGSGDVGLARLLRPSSGGAALLPIVEPASPETERRIRQSDCSHKLLAQAERRHHVETVRLRAQLSRLRRGMLGTAVAASAVTGLLMWLLSA